MKTFSFPSHRAFTLIELVTTIAIITILATMFSPVLGRLRNSADNAQCTNNLRQLGVLIHSAALENDNHFPQIENDRNDPIHTDGSKVQTLAELVQSQGGSLDLLKCPADLRGGGAAAAGRKASYYQLKGASYEWQPFFENALVSNPSIRGPFGQLTLPLSRVVLLKDYVEKSEGPHDRLPGSSSINCLYADGSVRKFVLSDAE